MPPSSIRCLVIGALSTFISVTVIAQTTQPAAPNSIPQPNPVYPFKYGPPNVQDVKDVLDHLRERLDAAMPIHVNDPNARRDERAADNEEQSKSDKHWPLISYPSGVTYTGMLMCADATGDPKFADFVARRFQFFADNYDKYASMPREQRRQNPFFNFYYPSSLDSCGAMGASMLRARAMKVGPDLSKITDRWVDYVHAQQYRLPDGTLARKSPFPESLWADDMYMGIPILAWGGKLSGNRELMDDAAKQVVQFGQHLFVPENGLFAHGWNSGDAENHPRYYWGRANGWCLVAMAELLDLMPEDHPMRGEVLRLFRAHARGLAEVQSGDGLWHQLLDRPDSYLETSATAMYVMAIARGANKGWLNASSYGPDAIAGWNGLVAKVSPDGKLSDVCVGTNYADDFVYYYHRPATDDWHGYGPTLMAGAEIIKLLNNDKLRITAGANRPITVTVKGQGQESSSHSP